METRQKLLDEFDVLLQNLSDDCLPPLPGFNDEQYTANVEVSWGDQFCQRTNTHFDSFPPYPFPTVTLIAGQALNCLYH